MTRRDALKAAAVGVAASIASAGDAAQPERRRLAGRSKC